MIVDGAIENTARAVLPGQLLLQKLLQVFGARIFSGKVVARSFKPLVFSPFLASAVQDKEPTSKYASSFTLPREQVSQPLCWLVRQGHQFNLDQTRTARSVPARLGRVGCNHAKAPPGAPKPAKNTPTSISCIHPVLSGRREFRLEDLALDLISLPSCWVAAGVRQAFP